MAHLQQTTAPVRQRRKRHPLRRLLRWTGALILMTILFFAMTSLAIVYTWKTAKAAPSDCIIVLGAAVWNGKPSPALKARADVAVERWRDGMAACVIATGGIGLPGEPSEAYATQQYMIRQGVPESAILLDDTSRNTYENIKNSKQLMDEHGYTSAIIVTHGFHTLRAELLARMFRIQVSASPAEARKESLLYYTLRECGGIAYLLATKPIPTIRAILHL